MSELTASQCGCERPCTSDNNCGCGGILWIIILLSICGGSGLGCFGSWGNSCGNSCGTSDCGNGCDSILFLILILCCCGGSIC